MNYRIAIISDIHGNVPALEACIADIKDIGVDEVLVGGDIVGRGPQGNAVTHRLIELGWPCIQGNHEEYLLGFYDNRIPASWWKEDIWAAARWMTAELDETAMSYIRHLPFDFVPEKVPYLRLVHDRPDRTRGGIGALTSDEDCLFYLSVIDEPCLVCGHLHRIHVRDFPQGKIVNVGSVGLPFNGDPRAQYAIFDYKEGETIPWDVEFRYVPYDRDELLRIYETSGFLTGGHVTAALLRIEIQTARSYLTPFLLWVAHHKLSPTFEMMDRFLELYDESQPRVIPPAPSQKTKEKAYCL